MPKTRVLFLANIPSPYRVLFFNELGKLCDLTVLYEIPTAADRDARWKEEITRKSYREIYLRPIVRRTDNALCPGVARHLKRGRYDHIIVGGYGTLTGMLAIELLRIRKIPFILSCDGGMVPNSEPRLKRRLKSHFISQAAHWLATGQGPARFFAHYGAKSERTHIYPFTSLTRDDIDDHVPTLDEKKALREKLGIKGDTVILSVGRVIPSKAYDILLQAALLMPSEWQHYIVGGKPTDDLRRFMDQNAVRNVHFVDHLSKDEVKQYYRSADLFALPTRTDVWGLVVNEAMAAGLPVVTTDMCVAGVELVRGNGEIVPVDDPQALADAIRRALTAPADQQAAMRDTSLQTIKGYTIEQMAQRHIDILDQIERQSR